MLHAFSYLAANGVQDLILDLRYNGGGYLYIAQELASYIAGNANHGNDFIKLIYNSTASGSERNIPSSDHCLSAFSFKDCCDNNP